MINLVIDILKANTTLTNLVSTDNIYPLIQLQGGNIPSVVVQLTNTTPNDTQEKVSTYDDNSVEVTCFAISPAAAWAISEAVRGAIDGYTGGNIAQIRFQSQATDIFESTEVFSVTQGYSVHLKRDGATLPIALAGLGELNLDDIADVDASNPSDDQVLTYDAATGTWGPEDASTVAGLDDLTDVTITTPANNQALVYNEAAGEWRNDQLSLTQLEGIDSELGNAIDRQALVFDESSNQWIADGVGQVVIPVRNPSKNNSIAVGTVLKATGAQGDRILVAPFEPATDDMKYFVGIASEVLGATNDTKDGHAQVYGELRDIDTDAFEVGDVLYAAAGGTLSTTENQYPIAIVTRKQQNTGRIFIRMWTPGKGYHQRYRTEALAEMFVGVGAEVELYYTATADGDGFVTQDLTATPAGGNVEERVLRYKSGAFGDSGTTTGYTDAGLATDATYAEMLTAFNNLLATESAPITIYATRTEVAARSGLLADYPGAAAAYSLRLLDTDYAGSAIRVRRASDNTEQDIGFDGNGDLDTTALATFCSGTNGFVKTWYDQSGNANDATQTTAANQPKIYDSVTGVVTDNGKPAVSFDGSNDFLAGSAWFDSVGSGTVFGVHRQFAQTTEKIVFQERVESTGFSRATLVYNSVTNTGISIGGRRISSDGYQSVGNQSWSGNQFLTSSLWRWEDAILESYINGASNGTSNSFQTAGNTNAGGLGLVIGGVAGGSYFNGSIQEIVAYPSNQSSNRTGIESNINDYYNIYP